MAVQYVDPMKQKYMTSRRTHWDTMAQKMRHWHGMSGYYHRRMNQVYAQMIPPGSRVLDIGCSDGNLLGYLKPSVGVGVDISPEMTVLAKEKHPEYTFICAEEDHFSTEDTFEFIILSDILNEAWDVQAIFEQIKKVAEPDARILINSYSRLWEYSLMAVEKLGLAKPMVGMNWLTPVDISNLLTLSGFDVIKMTREILFPIGIPLLS